jgi:DNA-binding response OmpR family regulator
MILLSFKVLNKMKKKILVADDDPGLQDIFGIILNDAGYDVEVLPNADSLLRNDFVVPDIFLIDKQLPGTDGLDVCRFLKEQQRTTDVPVLIISANSNLSREADEAGAVAFIEKPFDRKHLLKVISENIL